MIIYGTNQTFGTANLICVLVTKFNLAIAGSTRAHEMVRGNACLDWLVIIQLFVDFYRNSAPTKILWSTGDDVLIDIYPNKTLAPSKSLIY